MTSASRHDDLLHGRMDGELTAGELEALDRVLDENPEASARAAALDELADLLDSLGPADPPADLVQHVLLHLAASAPSAASPATGAGIVQFPARDEQSIRHAAVAARGGRGMGKKVMWGVAAAAVLALVGMKFLGYPPTGPGAEGTIGAARRYQAPQIASGDVAVSDAAAQAFMQSEAFDALLKDDNARKLLGDAGFRQRLSSAEFRKALADPGIRKALADPGLSRFLSDPGLRQQLEAADLRGPGLSRQLNDAGLRSALEDPGLRLALDSPGLRAALDDPGFRAMLGSPGFAAALRSPQMIAALGNPGFAKALSSQQFAARLNAR